MARSFRKPYAAVTSARSARTDKQMAARGVRRKQNRHLKLHWEEDDFLLPHRFECHHNDVWGWDRDGHQVLQVPTADDWSRFCLKTNGLHPYDQWPGYTSDAVWPPAWVADLTRK
jgi:hypothetical protein